MGEALGGLKGEKTSSFLLHTYGAAGPFCFDFRGFRL